MKAAAIHRLKSVANKKFQPKPKTNNTTGDHALANNKAAATFPELRRREVVHKGFVRPALWSASASRAKWSSFPACRSAPICSSHSSARYDCNQSRSVARSDGHKAMTSRSSRSTSVIVILPCSDVEPSALQMDCATSWAVGQREGIMTHSANCYKTDAALRRGDGR